MKVIDKYLNENDEQLTGLSFKGLSSIDKKNYKTLIFKSKDGRSFYPVMVSAKLTDSVVNKIIKITKDELK